MEEIEYGKKYQNGKIADLPSYSKLNSLSANKIV